MGQSESSALPRQEQVAKASAGRAGVIPPKRTARGASGGSFRQYKPEQGRWTRIGTLVGAGALIAWGAKFLYDRLRVYEDIESIWGLLITTGIPILFAVVLGAVAWWLTLSARKSSDFMIATEGEMKKVSWSSKREVIGSTRVVIVFTALLSVFLFIVDVCFQYLFKWFGVLKG